MTISNVTMIKEYKPLVEKAESLVARSKFDVEYAHEIIDSLENSQIRRVIDLYRDSKLFESSNSNDRQLNELVDRAQEVVRKLETTYGTRLSLSKADLFMAVSNSMQWGSYYLIKNALESDDLGPLTYLIPMYITGAAIDSIANFCMLPKNTSLIRKVLSFPMLTSISIHGYSLEFLDPIKRISNLYNVAQNSLPKLGKCVKNLTTRPIRALTYGAVHAFNLGSEIYSAATYFGLLNGNYKAEGKPKDKPSDSSKPRFEKPRTEQPQTPKFEKQDDDMSRLTNPNLNPKHLKDAQIMMQFPKQDVEPIQCHGKSYAREACEAACASVKKVWKEIFLRVHPDKNPHPLATVASQNLNNAKDTLSLAFNC